MANKSSQDAQKVAEQMHSAAIHLLRKLRREDAQSGLNAPRLSALSVIVFAGGRSTLIAATASGKQLLLKGRERRVRALARQIAALSAAEQRTLQEAAGILKSVIDAI
jgi:hypothetical protein